MVQFQGLLGNLGLIDACNKWWSSQEMEFFGLKGYKLRVVIVLVLSDKWFQMNWT